VCESSCDARGVPVYTPNPPVSDTSDRWPATLTCHRQRQALVPRCLWGDLRLLERCGGGAALLGFVGLFTIVKLAMCPLRAATVGPRAGCRQPTLQRRQFPDVLLEVGRASLLRVSCSIPRRHLLSRALTPLLYILSQGVALQQALLPRLVRGNMTSARLGWLHGVGLTAWKCLTSAHFALSLR
jgi:hypothetical protein